jgi:hypothetical protein
LSDTEQKPIGFYSMFWRNRTSQISPDNYSLFQDKEFLMFRKPFFLVVLVCLLALGSGLIGCGGGGGADVAVPGTWVADMSIKEALNIADKLDLADMLGPEYAAFASMPDWMLEMMLIQYGLSLNNKFPVSKINFNIPNTCTIYININTTPSDTPSWESILEGNWTQYGNTVTITYVDEVEGLTSTTGTIKGNTLTMVDPGTGISLQFNKK